MVRLYRFYCAQYPLMNIEVIVLLENKLKELVIEGGSTKCCLDTHCPAQCTVVGKYRRLFSVIVNNTSYAKEEKRCIYSKNLFRKINK